MKPEGDQPLLPVQSRPWMRNHCSCLTEMVRETARQLDGHPPRRLLAWRLLDRVLLPYHGRLSRPLVHFRAAAWHKHNGMPKELPCIGYRDGCHRSAAYACDIHRKQCAHAFAVASPQQCTPVRGLSIRDDISFHAEPLHRNVERTGGNMRKQTVSLWCLKSYKVSRQLLVAVCYLRTCSAMPCQVFRPGERSVTGITLVPG